MRTRGCCCGTISNSDGSITPPNFVVNTTFYRNVCAYYSGDDCAKEFTGNVIINRILNNIDIGFQLKASERCIGKAQKYHNADWYLVL